VNHVAWMQQQQQQQHHHHDDDCLWWAGIFTFCRLSMLRFSLSLHDETCYMTSEFSWLKEKNKTKKL